MHYKNIHELASLGFLKLNLEWENIKMGRKTYEGLFFSFMTIVLNHHHAIDIRVVSIAAVIFNSCSYYNSYTWSKNITFKLSKVILSGMYNSSFQAIN